jgi:predicted ATP-grasp superfamily ATP-dependent carboligase
LIKEGEFDLADIPQEGVLIEPGQPICTVFAERETRDVCLASLREMAHHLYTRLEMP